MVVQTVGEWKVSLQDDTLALEREPVGRRFKAYVNPDTGSVRRLEYWMRPHCRVSGYGDGEDLVYEMDADNDNSDNPKVKMHWSSQLKCGEDTTIESVEEDIYYLLCDAPIPGVWRRAHLGLERALSWLFDSSEQYEFAMRNDSKRKVYEKLRNLKNTPFDFARNSRTLG